MSKTVFITGASGGIGKELANRFAKDGYNMVLVARSEGKLAELAKEYREAYDVQVTVYAKDVSLPGVAEEIASDLKKKEITVDYLVNNAGFGLYGEFLETQLEQEMNMIDVNIKALTIMTKLFLPDMVKRRRGGVMNVASVGAFYPGPLMSVYFATKAYVLSFTEALENELSGTGVTVTALCPGPTATGFTGRAELGSSKLYKSGVMEVGEVADEAYRDFLRGKTLIIPGAVHRFITSLPRLLPRKAMTRSIRERTARVER
ncbi:SDR family NAD(P)-dependent oxidoreductase [Priestia megaterium]|uniref:SDR family NAD(P)-dependent oxidoreductase n=1 Tax=Priestia megaterium TaxID=1404 RepID=UPI001BEADC77|nr:SDR family oxidoreductase [Priestia megaterium]MBT2255735.1 SDR family oxidoreductase [Priestia megaterium]MBT2279540.1 SDR family oxidoreductase [Priestia megaterium]MCY9020419.1 SDR family oxidoreductase [Priestia megaterium]MCY9024455.1 SDR family oxidoreductase [Priestia megaterium]